MVRVLKKFFFSDSGNTAGCHVKVFVSFYGCFVYGWMLDVISPRWNIIKNLVQIKMCK